MTDLDTKLRESLRRTGDSFPRSSNRDVVERFERGRRRRGAVRGGATLLLVAALVAAATVVLPLSSEETTPAPIGPGPIPEGPIEITARVDVARGPHENAHGIATGESRLYVGQLSYPRATSIDPRSDRVDRKFAMPDLAEHVEAADQMLWGAGPGKLVGFDIASGRALDETLPLGQPTDLVAGDGWLWVGTSTRHGPQDRYVVLSRSTDDLSVPMVAPGPIGNTRFSTPPMLAYGYGALWLTQAEGGKGLFRWDPKTGELRAVPGIESASDVAVGPDGVWVYENSSKAMRSRLLRIDPETLEVEKKTTVLGYFAWLEADENGVWVLNASDETDRRLLRIDPETGDSMGASIRLGAGPFEMTSGFGSVWITDEGKAEVLRVDVVPGT